MHAFFPLTALLALGATAAPTRDATGIIRLCTDFDAGGRCADVSIPSGAIITKSPLFPRFSIYEVDGGQLSTLLGGCPSSAKILSPGLVCSLSDSFDAVTGCGIIRGDGHQIILDNLFGFRNFRGGPLNNNLRCIHCETFQ
ncbi:hypothetical protein QBC39DRAFT_384100 [Podospora conica]|nr:hypothetical protein QBC39DRAFT_384100 [Schizothecium conicum]